MDLYSTLGGTLVAWMAPLLPSETMFYLYLLTALALAFGSYVWFSWQADGARPDAVSRGFLAYVFDRRVWFHPSARQDYMYFVLNGLIYYGIVAQMLLAAHVLFGAFGQGFEAVFGARQTALFEPSTWSALGYTVVVLLAVDLAVWSTHYLQHRIPVLWQFHQVHHSAEVLTPATVYRMHPVDLFFTGFVSSGLIALALAGFTYMTLSEPSEFTVMNVNAGIFAFYLIGYNLRHSPVWLSYPPWLSCILISPAQHQIHHSVERRHWDRNMGLVFAFWDWLFGTLYVPKGYEKLEFGISKEEPNPFGSVSEFYWKPFRMAWRLRQPADGLRAPGRTAAIGIAGVAAATALLLQTPVFSATRGLPSLHLEELTWTEVSDALAQGYDTVIVPTGGVEQNGPHAVLGKHNLIVRHTSEAIAAQLGGTLVAPVLAYVPEGATGETPTDHMRWPGTLSVPEDVFASVLEHTARSLGTHGFTRILFLGDSLLNQAPQAEVAARLSEEWRGRGLTVLHVGDYYSANGQVEALVSDGLGDAEIGHHAGLRDTSELMAVAPAAVRTAPVPPPAGAAAGFDGRPDMATPELGRRLLDLKIDAALRQIRAAGRPSG